MILAGVCHRRFLLVLLALFCTMPARAEETALPQVGDSVAERVRRAAEDAQRTHGEPHESAAASDETHEAVAGAVEANTADAEDASANSDMHAEADHAAEEGAEHEGEAAGSWPEQRGPMPYEVVRSLQFLQDQIARGNAAAIRVQSQLLRYYGPTFVREQPDVWKDPRNMRALALYVLSGGPPDVLRELISQLRPQGEDEVMLKGALAYVENRTDEAVKLLSSLDLKFAEPSFAAQVQLALAQMEQMTASADALGRLERVMLLAPGTLLEEAALRLGVLLAEQNNDHAKADRYARQYFDRYGNSVYAANFRARFSAVYAERPAGTEEDTINTVADCVAKLPDDQQVTIYLAVARRALVAGRMTLATMASDRALRFKNVAEGDLQRAKLYDIAAGLTQRNVLEARAVLDTIKPEDLHPADRKLLTATADVLKQISKPLMISATMEGKPSADSPPMPDSDVLSRGEALLKEVRGDLASADE
ncbi:hypothetical protein [Aurantimonas sp. VKM B-3413]|uniref:hypothetical protein n=1 Tax=Aurantimonas sp. VKM B-3413 TaxID=2779401 RepID=UPI001E3D94ED|nr:hypothetical protein [Aurantimonas sp. VKM B-3413]MCB8838137.1 hypothetical protein [Aurantimonas sp. VKM B-3413]